MLFKNLDPGKKFVLKSSAKEITPFFTKLERTVISLQTLANHFEETKNEKITMGELKKLRLLTAIGTNGDLIPISEDEEIIELI
ncbi:MAG TPA: hypothetical protein PLB52_01220 [Candidatus Moranbacteria bacterium]|nr:hypothetical protein [Candidatus Moranbacteria bacterium]